MDREKFDRWTGREDLDARRSYHVVSPPRDTSILGIIYLRFVEQTKQVRKCRFGAHEERNSCFFLYNNKAKEMQKGFYCQRLVN